jgi:hypothetical protein
MAKVGKNIVVADLQGTIGNLVFRSMPNGTTHVSRKPDFSNRVFSAGQTDHQFRFRQAAVYAREAARTQPIYAQLAAGQQKSPYNYALSDWFHPPVIHRLEFQEGCLRIQASDDVLVARVLITVLDDTGQVLEQGPAVRLEPAKAGALQWWEYAPETTGKILAEAFDLPGNPTRSEL